MILHAVHRTELGVREQIRHLLCHYHAASLERRECIARFHTQRQRAISRAGNEHILRQERVRSTGTPKCAYVRSVATIEHDGLASPGRHEKLCLRRKQVPLRRQPIELVDRAVLPQFRSVGGVNSTHVQALSGKQSRAEVGDAVVHENACSNGPERHHTAVP